MEVLFTLSVLFGCYSSGAIDEVITDRFDETEMRELVDSGECFYGWHEEVAVDGIYKSFLWSDNDEMVVMHGRMPDGKDIYFWGPLDKYKEHLHNSVFHNEV